MNQQPMSTLAQLAELLLQNTQATLVGDGALAINRVHTDTRTLQAGDLFIEVLGQDVDLTDFVVFAACEQLDLRNRLVGK